MDTKDLPAAKADLELKIREAIRAEIDAFTESTGLAVTSVEVQMIDCTMIDGIVRSTLLGAVDVGVGI